MQDDKLIKQISSIGLSDKSAIVYATLLNLGGAYPSKIAEYSKLNRSTTYKILIDLSIKGLINESRKHNKLYYQIEKPEKLLNYTKKQITLSEDRYEKAIKLIPELEGLFSITTNKPVIRFYEGVDGIIEIYKDHINVQKPYEMLAFSNTAQIIDFLPKKFAQEYIKVKNRLEITSRGIVPDTEIDKKYNEIMYSNVKEKIKVDLIYIPADIFPYKSEITLYGQNKVSIQNFSKEHPVGVIIEDATLYNMMLMIFELSWAGAKSLYP